MRIYGGEFYAAGCTYVCSDIFHYDECSVSVFLVICKFNKFFNAKFIAAMIIGI